MKYKVIKSAAHNFGHSFVSTMNYLADDYVMSHLARAAVASGEAELRVDLISGHAEPAALVTPPVSESIEDRLVWFPHLLASHGITPSVICGAKMSIRYDLARRSPDMAFPGYFQMPFTCTVEILDDRGKVHVGEVRDWWSADERPGTDTSTRRWWNLWRRP